MNLAFKFSKIHKYYVTRQSARWVYYVQRSSQRFYARCKRMEQV